MNSTNSFSRRGFIKRAAVAGAIPFILPSSVWSNPTNPNDKITLGFVGMGTQNRGLMGGFLGRDDTRVVAVCDVDKNRREAAQKTVNGHYKVEKGCDAYSDFRELIARKDIDGVVIATPDHWHALIAIAALKSGKDVYCEKPMAHTVAEGRAMVKATRENKRILQVGSMQRSMKEFRAACELVRNGVLGKISKVEVSIGAPAIPCDLPEEAMEAGLDWDMWLGPAPKRPYNSVLSPRGVHGHFPDWRKYREYATGMIGDWGAHHFDIAQWALGYDDSGPTEFFAAEKENAQSGVRFRYSTGEEVIHTPGNNIVFFGEKGKIEVNRGSFKLWLGNEQKAKEPNECEEVLSQLLPANAVRLYKSGNHLSDFIQCMRSRKLPICDVEIGHRTASVCNIVSQVYYHHVNVKWDPKKEQFTEGGDPKWLLPEFRGPWTL
jgi:predicted dehydrogenase